MIITDLHDIHCMTFINSRLVTYIHMQPAHLYATPRAVIDDNTGQVKIRKDILREHDQRAAYVCDSNLTRKNRISATRYLTAASALRRRLPPPSTTSWLPDRSSSFCLFPASSTLRKLLSVQQSATDSNSVRENDKCSL